MKAAVRIVCSFCKTFNQWKLLAVLNVLRKSQKKTSRANFTKKNLTAYVSLGIFLNFSHTLFFKILPDTCFWNNQTLLVHWNLCWFLQYLNHLSPLEWWLIFWWYFPHLCWSDLILKGKFKIILSLVWGWYSSLFCIIIQAVYSPDRKNLEKVKTSSKDGNDQTSALAYFLSVNAIKSSLQSRMHTRIFPHWILRLLWFLLISWGPTSQLARQKVV